MRKLLSFFLWLLLFLPFIHHSALAQSDWIIENFSSNIVIEKTGELSVQETIQTNFGTTEKHGIYRDIPYVYQTSSNGEKYTELTVQSVKRDGKNEAFHIEKNASYLRIQVGDAEKTIQGKHTYTISYQVKGVIVPYVSYDELYWNVTGNAWDAPILHAEAMLALPQPELIQTACYFGIRGSTSQCRDEKRDATHALFSTDKLSPNEGMTIAAGFQKGIVPILSVEKPKTFFERLVEPVNLITFFLISLLGVGYIFLKWWKEGRDYWNRNFPSGTDRGELKPVISHETIVVEFTPPENIRPAEMGVIMDERADTLDITATFIDLAQRGYVTIEEIKKTWMFGKNDYLLKLTKKPDTKLLSYEKELLSRLFSNDETSVSLSSLKLTFYDDLKNVKDNLYKDITQKKFFVGNPEKVRQKYLLWGIIVGVIPLVFFSITGFVLMSPLLVALSGGLFVTGVTVSIFSQFMSRRTILGRDLYRRSLGYRLFINGAEKYRQQFYEKNNLFNEILPYTIIFGLTEKFAKAMKDMGIEPTQPTWYRGYSAFNAATFTQSMNSFSKTLSSAMAAAPSSSGSGGGGSSGGGFGGGGGGSW